MARGGAVAIASCGTANTGGRVVILVVGATGMLGGAILRELLDRGEEVRALVRESSAERALRKAGAETVSGDLKDPASLPPACQGVSTLVTTANSAGRGGDDNVETVDLEGNHSLIEAASASGVEHFIFVSAQGEDPDSPVPFLRAKGLASKRLRDSGIAYTVLAPDIYMDVWVPLVVLGPVASGRPVTIVGEGARKHYLMAVDDVAGFAVAAVGNDAVRNRGTDASIPRTPGQGPVSVGQQSRQAFGSLSGRTTAVVAPLADLAPAFAYRSGAPRRLRSAASAWLRASRKSCLRRPERTISESPLRLGARSRIHGEAEL